MAVIRFIFVTLQRTIYTYHLTALYYVPEELTNKVPRVIADFCRGVSEIFVLPIFYAA